jgi:hypothetical protein
MQLFLARLDDPHKGRFGDLIAYVGANFSARCRKLPGILDPPILLPIVNEVTAASSLITRASVALLSSVAFSGPGRCRNQGRAS